MKALDDNLSAESGDSGEPPPFRLTRRIMRQAGIVRHGWQYELPLSLPGNVLPNDIICGINPVTKEPDLTLHYLVKAVGEDGKVVAAALGFADSDKEVRVFDPDDVFKIASAFKSNL